MTNKTATKPIVKLKIETGPGTPVQKTAGRKFWQRIINSVREELQAESEGRK